MTIEAIYKALGDPSRVKITALLGEKDCTVDELKDGAGISQSSTSQHLKILYKADLVSYKKHGNFRIYSLQKEQLSKAMHFFDGLWEKDLQTLKTKLENK